MPLESLNSLVGFGTLALQIGSVVLLALFFMKERVVSGLMQTFALPLAFVLAFAATAMSLVYSEYYGIVPCGLCWVQRVFLYPQVILLGIALWKKDTGIAFYSIVLSVIGAAVALYQHYLQMGGTSVLPCPASGVADCAQRFIFELGYITFPLVSFSLFAFLIILMLFVRRASK